MKINDKFDFSSLTSLFRSAAEVYSNKTAFCYFVKDHWVEKSYKEFHEEVTHLSQWFKVKGLNAGDKILMVCESRYDWLSFMLACSYCDLILVPIDSKLSEKEAASLIDFIQPQMLVLSSKTEVFVNKVLKFLKVDIDEFLLLNDVNEDNFLSEMPHWNHQKLVDSNIESTRLIIFTSGTFSNPKGAEILEKNILLGIKSASQIMATDGHERVLSILPMNHIFELIASLSTTHILGSEICIAQSLEKEHLFHCFNHKKITRMCAVPLFLRSIYQGIQTNINELSSFKKNIFNFLFYVSKFCSQDQRRKLFNGIHKKFGGSFKLVVSGGAPLGKDLMNFFDRIGIIILEGYGLTETCAIVTTNKPDDRRIGSVGKPMDGVEVKIDSDEGVGEIFIRGISVMKGYLSNLEATNSSMTSDGWFKTGDLGYLDQDEFLFITGRKKKMIALEGGKKVYAEEVESFFNQLDCILESCVVAPDKYKDSSEEQMNEFGLAVVPSDELMKQVLDYEELKDYLSIKVKSSYEDLTHYKRPSCIFVLPEELQKRLRSKSNLMML